MIIDAKSKWAETEISKSASTSTSSIGILQNVFPHTGFPDVMVSENATIFTSDQFKKIYKEAGTFQKFIAPGHSSTNGLAERNIQTLKHRLAAMEAEHQSIC